MVHGATGGKTEAWCGDVVAVGKPLLVLEAAENAGPIEMEAWPVAEGALPPSFAVGWAKSAARDTPGTN